jgi:hypothetical protein
LREERAILDTLLHLSESLTRTEGLLGIRTSEDELQKPRENEQPEESSSSRTGRPKLAVIIDAGEEEEEPKDIKTITRIANEYTQVMYLVMKARAEECEYVLGDEGSVESVSCSIRFELLCTQY